MRKMGEVKIYCCICTSSEERLFVVYRYVNVGRCSLVMAMGKAVIQRVIPLLIVREVVVFHKIPLGNAGGR